MADMNAFSILAGIGVGAAAMYVLDPQQGARRRALARDKVTEAKNRLREAARVTARDLGNRSAGIAAEARSRLFENAVDDEIIEGRVRSKLGFLVRHPSALTVQVAEGRVTLSGPVLSDEVQQLIGGVKAVRGVVGVENNLAVHDDPAQVPALQSDKPKPSGEVWDIMQRRWSPSTRFLVGSAGALSLGLIAYSFADGPPRSDRPSALPGQKPEEELAASPGRHD